MDKKKNIAIVGADGKMGKNICEKLKNSFEVIKITEKNSLEDFKNIDLVVDFSTATQSVLTAKYCEKNNIPLIIGATGQSETQIIEIEKIGKNIPILMCENFSIGIMILKNLIKSMKDYFNDKDLDITIIEKHHRLKKDLPSGTALALKREIEKNTNSNVKLLSERGGTEIGTHIIDIYFENELLTFSHKAFSRDAFSNGVVKIINIWDKKGLKSKLEFYIN